MKGRGLKKVFLVSALTLLTYSGVTQAATKVCSLNIEKAYQTAVKSGYKFSCKHSVIHFDGAKRVGCLAKSSLSPLPAIAELFVKPTVEQPFRNGWSLHSYKVSGGEHIRHGGGNPYFSFKRPPLGSSANYKRYLSEFKLKKNNGNCSKVYNEAFG